KVFAGPSFTASVWVNDLDRAIAAINQLLKQSGVYLAFKKADKESGSPIVAETYPGTGLHGNAALTVVDSRGGTWLDSVKLRVPAPPKIGQVDAGQAMRLHILVHELVHCIGLTNCAHSDDDVFIARPVISVGAVQGGKVLPLNGDGSIPPPKLGAHT